MKTIMNRFISRKIKEYDGTVFPKEYDGMENFG